MNLGDKVNVMIGGTKRQGEVTGVNRDTVVVKIGDKFVTINVEKRADEPDYKDIKSITEVDDEGRERLYG